MTAALLGVSKRDDSHRRLGVWSLDTYNGNTASTAQSYLDSTRADVFLLQEKRVRGDPAQSGSAAG